MNLKLQAHMINVATFLVFISAPAWSENSDRFGSNVRATLTTEAQIHSGAAAPLDLKILSSRAHILKSYKTIGDGVLTLVKTNEPGCDIAPCHIYFNNKLILEAGHLPNGYSASFATRDAELDYSKPGKKEKSKVNRLIVQRAIFQEVTGMDGLRFWILDFRGKVPELLGPMAEGDASSKYDVDWSKDEVVVTMTETGTRYSFNWKTQEFDYPPAKSLNQSVLPRVPTDIRDCWGHRANEPECQTLNNRKNKH